MARREQSHSQWREQVTDASKVFILYRHALFASGISSLLGSQPGLQIVGMDADWSRAAERIDALRPDVVVMDGDSSSADLLEAVGRVIAQAAEIKVIRVSLSSNNASVYRAQQMVIGKTEDLIEAIRTA